MTFAVRAGDQDLRMSATVRTHARTQKMSE